MITGQEELEWSQGRQTEQVSLAADPGVLNTEKEQSEQKYI